MGCNSRLSLPLPQAQARAQVLVRAQALVQPAAWVRAQKVEAPVILRQGYWDQSVPADQFFCAVCEQAG